VTATDWTQLGSLAVVLAALGVSAYQVRIAADQTRTLVRTLQQTADSSVTALQTQARMSFLLEDPELLAWHLRSRGCAGDSYEQNKMRLYILTKLIAHETTYVGYEDGVISPATWSSWEAVVRTDVLMPEAREIWAPMRTFHAPVFVRYVDDLIRRNPLPDGETDPR
jgi:hypothetical protein